MTNETCTIVLTDRAPVRIKSALWPIVAKADWDWFEGQHRCQANRTQEAWIRVRRHSDGRAIVSARAATESRWMNETDTCDKQGLMVPTDGDLIEAIHQVWNALDKPGRCPDLVSACIASLPPEDVD